MLGPIYTKQRITKDIKQNFRFRLHLMTCCELVKSGAKSRYYLLDNQSKHFPFRQGQRKLTRFIFGTDKCMDGWAGITSRQHKAF